MNEQPHPDNLEPWQLKPATDLDLPVGERLRSLSRERGLLDTAIGFVWWGAMRIYLRSYHRLRIYGKAQLPMAAPFVVVANHSSHLDAMTLACVLPRRLRHCIYPIAAGDHFFQSPATATFAAFVLNALPMWRRNTGRYALQQLRQRLVQEPCAYILFPEGTRSRNGELGRFKPVLGMLVAGTEVKVVPCYLQGAHAALPHDKKFPRPKKVQLYVGEPLSFTEVANDREGWSQVAQATEAAVRKLAAQK